MPTSANPDPTGSHPAALPSSIGSADDQERTVRTSRAGSSVNAKPTDNSAEPMPVGDMPTIISTNRPRAVPDNSLGESLAGRKLGHFELIEPIGVGGMAAVIRARDLDLNRIVALKILPPDMATDPENITRFKHEARAAAKLDHENIARVYFCGEDQGLHFIAFEFVEGKNLRVHLEERGPLPVGECIRYMLHIAAGLSHAASRNVVHRDIKPSNIIITPEGKAKIVDMGLARNLDPHTVNGGVTQSGVTLGTFDYISPEQALEPRQADVRSDIYSLGCTFYHVLTGRPPVPEGTAAKKLHAHQHIQPLDPRELNPLIPDDLTAVLAKMMAKDVAKRYQTPEDLIRHLLALASKYNVAVENIALPKEPSAMPVSPEEPLPPPNLIGWITAVVMVFILGGWLYLSTHTTAVNETADPIAPWQQEQRVGEPRTLFETQPIPKQPTPPTIESPRNEVRSAATVAELVELIRNNIAHIQLTGREYDLTQPLSEEEGIPALLLQGNDLILEGADNSQPILHVRATPQQVGGGLRAGTLTFQGNGGSAKLLIRSLRIRISAPPIPLPNAAVLPMTALYISDFAQVRIERCAVEAPSDAPGMIALAAACSSPSLDGGFLALVQCFFPRGWTALEMYGRMRLDARDCAFGPHAKLVRVSADSAESLAGKTPEVRFERCSVLLDERGSVVEVGPRLPCTITAGHSLFCGIDGPLNRLPDLAFPRFFKPPLPVLIRRLGTKAAAVTFRPIPAPGEAGNALPLPNGFYRLLAYADENRTYSFDECRRKPELGIDDDGARFLTESPLVATRPLEALASERPLSAFRVRTDRSQLRVARPEPSVIEGVLGILNTYLDARAYDLPLGRVPDDAVVNGKRKVWQPDYPADQLLPQNTYRSLVAALDEVKPGDELIIRSSGRLLEIDPVRFTKPGLQLTIKADVGYRPILTLKDTPEANASLFLLFDGRLVLENLQFLLRSRRPEKEVSRSVVTIVGGGECIFRQCIATLKNDKDDVQFAFATLDDPGSQMKMDSPERRPSPKVRMEYCLIRGRGRLLPAKVSRPFDLEIDGSLVILDGNGIQIEPNPRDMLTMGTARLQLQQSTIVLSGHFLTAQAASRFGLDVRSVGLVPTEVQAVQCVFASVGPQPKSFIRFERLDGRAQLEEKELFRWRNGKWNLYAFAPTHPMLEIVPENNEGMMAVKPLSGKDWPSITFEAGEPFGRVRFDPVPEIPFLNVRPRDFIIKAIDPPYKPDGDKPVELGAPIARFEERTIDPAPIEE